MVRKRQHAPLADSVSGVASLLSSSERTVWRLIARGELPTFKVGRKTLVPREATERLVAGAR